MGMLLTPYLVRRSLESGELMILLRMCEGALKWRFRFFLREEDTILLNFMAAVKQEKQVDMMSKQTSPHPRKFYTLPYPMAVFYIYNIMAH